VRILAFDPGETTGWCYVDTSGSLESGDFLTYTGVCDILARTGPDLVIIERFLLYPWSARRLKWNKLVAVEVIGVARFLCEEERIPYILRNAAVAKSVKLKEPLASKHATDAFRHILAYLKAENMLGEFSKYILGGP